LQSGSGVCRLDVINDNGDEFMTDNTAITVAYGDGIGPEIMEATLRILKEAGARLMIDTIEIGESLYLKGFGSGISDEAMSTVKRNKILLKAPITTPQGKGYKSLNVTFRKALGLYANVRPTIAYHPFVATNNPGMDMVIVRENEEDLYAGVEYMSTPNSNFAFKLITHQGCERIIRYAFEYARINKRKCVTCISKDNIMKVTDGMFHRVFDEIALEYPDIKNNHYIVDIGAAKIANSPEIFDVIVTLNLYGDILSDIASEVSGSVGLAGSSNIGREYAMFEAVHGSAPDIAGKGIANPSGLLQAAILMLEYIGQADVAVAIQNAWLKTIEDGMHTADVFNTQYSVKRLSTGEFADAVIKNLGKKPSKLAVAAPKEPRKITIPEAVIPDYAEELMGIDIYVKNLSHSTFDMAEKVEDINQRFELQHIAVRGIKVWPGNEDLKFSDDLWRLRYIKKNASDNINIADLLQLQGDIYNLGLEIVLTHNLCTWNGMAGFTKAQGE